MDSTIVILKALIMIHNYLKKGPYEVINQKENGKNMCEEILKGINNHWKKVL